MEVKLNDELLSKTLDNMGFEKDQVNWRQEMWSWLEFIRGTLVAEEDSVYMTGSSIEGSGLRELKSDLDVMYCFGAIEVMSDIGHWIPNRIHQMVFMDTLNVHPGYTQLKLLSQQSKTLVKARNVLHLPKNFVRSSDGTLLLLNTVLKKIDTVNNSPASTTFTSKGRGVDMVMCLRCDSWPHDAQEWVTRYRPFNWPNREFVETMTERGCLLVSTCHKDSRWPETEWRLSFSLIERELIWRWPTKELKCYVLLKFVKTVMKTKINCNLNSYHLKTLMFWLSEETGFSWWSSHTLTECFILSLERLLNWIDRGSCPNYFITNNNMFDTLTPENRRSISRIIREVLSNKDKYLLHSVSFRKFCKWTYVTSHNRQHSETLRSVTVAKREIRFSSLTQHCDILKNMTMSFLQRPIMELQKDKRECLHPSIQYLLRSRSKLKTKYQHELLHVRRSLLNIQLLFLQGFLASVLSSFCVTEFMCNTEKYKLLRLILNLFTPSVMTDVTSIKLKVAVHFYRTRQLESAVHVLDWILNSYKSFVIPFGPGTIRYSCSKQSEKLYNMNINSFGKVLKRCVAIDSVLVFAEMFGTPSGVVYEAFKVPKSRMNTFEFRHPAFQNIFVVDSLVLVYFLQFMCFHQLGYTNHRHVALENLKWSTKRREHTPRLSTALNLLGSCYITMGDIRRGTDCFVQSLRVQPSHNAAFWHILIVLLKCYTV